MLANVDLARRDGADLRFSEPVTHWASTPGGGVDVATARGRYGADRLVLGGHPVYLEEIDGNGELYGFPMVDGPAGRLKLA